MSNEQVINPNAIEALRAVAPEDGGAFLTELIDIFLADTPPRLAEINRGIAENADAVVARAAHSIKGSSGNFGAERVMRLAHEVEIAAKAKDLAASATLAAQLDLAYSEAANRLRTLRRT